MRSASRLSVVVAAAACSLVAGGCRSRPEPTPGGAPWEPTPAPDLGAVVARVAGVPIFSAEVQAEMTRSGSSAEDALEKLVDLHLLAERGRRAGRTLPLSEVPPALLVQRLLERELEPGTTMQNMPEDDLLRAYQQTKLNYVHPRMVEVALLSVYTGPNMRADARERSRKTAQDLAEELRRRPVKTPKEMFELSESPEWKPRKVAYWKFWQGPTREHGPFGGKVAPAVQKLRKGELSAMIEDESGYHFALYLDEKPPKNVSFVDAKEEIREKAYPAWRRHRFETLVAGMAKDHRIEMFRDRVSAASPR